MARENARPRTLNRARRELRFMPRLSPTAKTITHHKRALAPFCISEERRVSSFVRERPLESSFKKSFLKTRHMTRVQKEYKRAFNESLPRDPAAESKMAEISFIGDPPFSAIIPENKKGLKSANIFMAEGA